MNKVFLIIWREYFERIRKKSFILMSILGPILIAGGFALMIWLTNADKTNQKIQVIDASFAFSKLPDNDFIKFYYPDVNLKEAINQFYKTDFTCILYVPYNIAQGGKTSVQLYYKKSPGFATTQYMKDVMEKKLYEFKLAANNIDPSVIKNARQSINFINWEVPETGEISNKSDVVVYIGIACGVLIFIFLTVYGAQVMRSVMEEKTSRIVEIIISSVRPFQLMIGKIVGVALVGITQFLIWIVLSSILTTLVTTTLLKSVTDDYNKNKQQVETIFKQGSNLAPKDLEKIQSNEEAIKALEAIKKINFPIVVTFFLVYFLAGYLFYSALFAAIGSAVDSEADTQQFMLPVMLPLMISYVMAIMAAQNPDGKIAFWGSLIPFSSPILMLVRLPNGVPSWQIAVSLSLLILGFIFTVWLAGRIYRTGILMYGKKVTWKEIIKWVTYKA
ncbi:MAG TPA: ABC transporter permease [Bacteroidia bacterium]|jgi:ABC-2 type transport system permease protein|nr:ABC transporter permease [Bacteroidia bacterium]